VNETTDLSRVWTEVEEQLPSGWRLDGLRCASTGLAPEDRSEDWVAVAIGPDGETRTCRAVEPGDALRGLATVVE
jgi:hypothetical protein